MSTSSTTLTLSDNRTLAYAEYGRSQQPTSGAVFYFHGYPSSRFEGAFWDETASDLGARLIAIDRPGIGLSTFQEERSFLDWPNDVLELADHLQVKQFYILGLSGGGPFVLACVREIPSERLLGAAIVSGMYPPYLGMEGMKWSNRILLHIASSSWLSFLMAPLLDWEFGTAARDTEHPEALEDVFMKMLSRSPEQDRRLFNDRTLMKKVVDAHRECFRSSSVGIAYEGKLYLNDWGFKLEEVSGERLCLWHGKQDVNIPVGMAERAAPLLRGAELRVFDETHMTLPVRYGAGILKQLLP